MSVAVSAAGVTVTNNSGIKDDLSGPGGSPGSPFSNGYHLMSPYNHYNLTSGPPPGPDQQSMVSLISKMHNLLLKTAVKVFCPILIGRKQLK